MLAFAGNSLLTRKALLSTTIDAASFSAIRLGAGAVTLALLMLLNRQALVVHRSSWLSAALLFIYTACFSYAYRGLDTGFGALVLFASSQLLMLSVGLWRGEQSSWLGLSLAGVGFLAFLWPSEAAPQLLYSLLMCVAGLAWGGFSIVGKKGGAPLVVTAISFLLAVLFALLLLLAQLNALQLDWTGALYAVLSGSLTSALGYSLWYWVRGQLAVITAGTVQLSVPVISALLGMLLLGEHMAWHSICAGLLVLAGVGWTSWATQQRKSGQ